MNKKKLCIYKITSPTGRIYIGLTSMRYQRFYSYRNLKNNIKGQRRLYYSLKKYGWENHKVEIIRDNIPNRKEACVWERYYIYKYDTYRTEHGLNLTKGGDSAVTWTDEMRKRQSKIMKERMRKNNLMSNSEYYEKMVNSIRTKEHRKLKSDIMKKSHTNHRFRKAVIQMNKWGDKINSFHSAAEAGRLLRLRANKIAMVCNGYGNRRFHGGFMWRWE